MLWISSSTEKRHRVVTPLIVPKLMTRCAHFVCVTHVSSSTPRSSNDHFQRDSHVRAMSPARLRDGAIELIALSSCKRWTSSITPHRRRTPSVENEIVRATLRRSHLDHFDHDRPLKPYSRLYIRLDWRDGWREASAISASPLRPLLRQILVDSARRPRNDWVPIPTVRTRRSRSLYRR